MNELKIAVIQGDGIGNEVIPEGIKILESISTRFNISFLWEEFDWSCEHYAKTGKMMPDDGLQQLARKDAIFLGAVGFPGVPDHISLWGLLIPIRRAFHQYIKQHRAASGYIFEIQTGQIYPRKSPRKRVGMSFGWDLKKLDHLIQVQHLSEIHPGNTMSLVPYMWM